MVVSRLRGTLTRSSCLVLIFSGAFLAFGLCHVHAASGVTEGGVLGATLLMKVHFDWSPAFTGLILNALCYALGWKTMGIRFLVRSGVSALAFSASYRLFERMPNAFPFLADMPLLAALMGAVFVGVGFGLCVKACGAPSGDDALAMSLSRLMKVKIEWVYFVSDFTILVLSLTYIPLGEIVYSLITVVLSSRIIGLIQRAPSSRIFD